LICPAVVAASSARATFAPLAQVIARPVPSLWSAAPD